MKNISLAWALFLFQTFECTQITISTPQSLSGFKQMQANCRNLAANENRTGALFPTIKAQFQDHTQINPTFGPYSEEHLRMLFILDQWGKRISKSFDQIITELKTALGVKSIEWNYLPCRAGISIDQRQEGFGLCWLNALANAARFYDPELLEQQNVLNNSQWQELVTLLLESVKEPSAAVAKNPKNRYQQLITALNNAFNQNQGYMSTALVLALFQNRKKLNQTTSSNSLINKYLRAILTLLGQCVQIPQVRSGSSVLLDLNIAPTLFMTDKKAAVENPDSQFGQEEQMITHVLRIDPSQALSQEQWKDFKAGTLPLILFFTISHNIAPGSGTTCQEHSNRPETPHVVAIRMKIEDQTLHLEIIDSFSHDPLEGPSFVPGVLMTFSEFVQQATSKIGASQKPNLLPEARMKEYADYLGNLGQFYDKTYPSQEESVEKLKTLLDSNFRQWEALPKDLVQAKNQYRTFIAFLTKAFELLPDGVRFNYAESFFTNGTWINRAPGQGTGRTSLLPFNLRWEEIGKVFEMGIGLPKEKRVFIRKVFKWRDQTEANHNPFSSLQFSFIFGTGLNTQLQFKLIDQRHQFEPNPFPEHLKKCSECRVLLKKAEDNDHERFSQWDRPVPKPPLAHRPTAPRLSPRTPPAAAKAPASRQDPTQEALPEPQPAAATTSHKRQPMTTPVQLPVLRPLTVAKPLQTPEQPLPKIVNLPPESKIDKSRPSSKHFRMSIRRRDQNGNLEIIQVRNKQKAIEELKIVLAQIKQKRATEQKTEEIAKLEALIEKLLEQTPSREGRRFHLRLRTEKPISLNPS